ncbi:MAG: hypothetical protein H8E72_08780 [Candidatus Marinimicrobia bacterium]|nr:hypothetical protein [Candidatus Neomarinimicrobiota bacterium]
MKKIILIIMAISFSWTQCDEECIAGVTQDCCEHSDCGANEYCYTYLGWLGNENKACWPDNFEDGCCAENDSVDMDCDGDSDLLDCPADCFSNAPGPYSIGIILEENGLRDGPDYQGGMVYYPVEADGLLPAIVMVPGFMSEISSIENWGPYLASHGVITIFVNANWPWHSSLERAYSLLDGIVTLQAENDRLASPLFEKLNLDQLAVGGWSRGGGGALMATVMEPSIKAVIALSPWLDTEYISPTVLDDMAKPILFMSGELDEGAPNDVYTNVIYDYLPESTDRLLYEVSMGDHNTVTSPYNNVYLGPKTLYWIEKYVLDDPINCDLLINEPPTASQFMTNVECQTMGDVNGDDVINVLDIVILVDMILNAPGYNSVADYNGDGNVDILDIVAIVQVIVNN